MIDKKQIIESIEHLLRDSGITLYRIGKDLGINDNTLRKYTTGDSKVENMSLANGIKLYNYSLEGGKAMNSSTSREESFGRILGVLNKISLRHFEKGKPEIEAGLGKDFDRKPMTLATEAFKDITKYAHKFDATDSALMDRVTKYISEIDPNDFSDKPLAPSYLIFTSKEVVELDDLIKGDKLRKEN